MGWLGLHTPGTLEPSWVVPVITLEIKEVAGGARHREAPCRSFLNLLGLPGAKGQRLLFLFPRERNRGSGKGKAKEAEVRPEIEPWCPGLVDARHQSGRFALS